MTATHRGSAVINRRLTLAVLGIAPLMLALVVGQVGALTPTVVREHLGEELTIEVDPGSLVLCEGETDSILVTLRKVGVYQDVEERWYVPRPRPYRLVNNNWGRQLPGFSSSTPDPSVVFFRHLFIDEVANDGLRSSYLVTGEKKGSTTIEFVASLGSLRSRDVDVDIEVVECDYEVHTFSIWHLSATGWNTVVGSSIDTVIVRQPQAPGTQIVDLENLSAIAENVAVEFPSFGCDSAVTLSTMRAPVWGEVNLAQPKLTITIDYPDIVPDSKFVTCGGLPGSRSDTGRLDPISFDFGVGGGTDAGGHILRAPGLGDFTGVTYITVRPIHR